jgi:hypothetical protein
MKKNKIRFNLIDLLIILVIAAAVFLLLYVFVFSGNKNQAEDVNYTNIRYVFEIQKVDSRFEDLVEVGQPVQDAVERRSIGTVTGVQAVPYQKLVYDANTGAEVAADVENMITLKITVEATAIETDRAFSVDGCIIKVGKQYSLALPGMYCVGYCTYIGDSRQ